MALDGIILHQLNKQLKALLPIKINKIQQISNDEILLILHGKGSKTRVMISAHSVYNRIHITSKEYQSVEIPNTFTMVLRKYIDRGIISEIEQMGLDRILRIKIEVKDELHDLHYFYLYIELMGKYANIILVNDQNTIVDALKRIPSFESNRTIYPSARFVLPTPHLDKVDPFISNEVNTSLSLVKQFHGFSPILSDAVLNQLKTRPFTDIMKQIAASQSLYVYTTANTTHFHVIPLTQLDTPYQVYPIHEGMDFLYYQKEEKIRIKQQNGDLYKVVTRELKKNQKKLIKLKDTLNQANQLDLYRQYGDILYSAYAHYHEHLASITLDDFEGSTCTIPLDSKINVKQNAKKYYQKYSKSKTAQIEMGKQINKTKQAIQYFETIAVQLEQANLHDALEIKQELENLGYMKASKARIRKVKKQAKPAFLTLEIDGTRIYVGKNNIQNDYITFKQARKDDTWFHVKDMHGSHVVIASEEPSEEMIRLCAQFAAYFSQAKTSSSVPVNYCLIRHLRKVNQSNLGFVTLTSYKTIYIDPDEQYIEKMIVKYQILK